jgi:hypothetical protein
MLFTVIYKLETHHVQDFERSRRVAAVVTEEMACGKNIDNGGMSTRFHMSNVLQGVT